MNTEEIEIDGMPYLIDIENDTIQSITEKPSYFDTASGKIYSSIKDMNRVEASPFSAHVHNDVMGTVMQVIGKYLHEDDFAIQYIEESSIADDATFIRWTQESAEDCYDIPKTDTTVREGGLFS